jgi:hypothetical protein
MNSFRRIAIAATVVTALSLVGATGAFAKAETTAAQWFAGTTKGSLTKLVGSQAVTVEFGEHKFPDGTTGKKGTLNTKILGVNFDSTAAGVKCIECRISNEIAPKTGVATGTGKIEFTGVVPMEPVGCKVSGEKIVTNQVYIEADYMEGKKHLIRIIPASGELFSTTKLEGCALEGSYPSKGVLFAEAVGETGTESSAPGYTSSAAISSAAGGTLTLGGNALTIEGQLAFKAEGKFLAVK